MNTPGSSSENPSSGLQTLSIALELIKELQERNGATVAELQQGVDLSRSAIYNHLNTLYEHSFVAKEGEEFKLSLRFILLGEFVREQNNLYKVARAPIKELAESTGYTAHMVTEQHYDRIEIYVARGDHAVGRRFASVYDTVMFHTTANGKAILAFADDETRTNILQKHNLSRRTPNTITDQETLKSELEQIRERGYAINDEEEIEGLRGVAAPILGQGNTIKGAVAIDAPVAKMPEGRIHEELVEQVMQTANVIQVDLNMTDRSSH